MNHTKTVLLLGALTGLFLLVGYAIGGNNGMLIALGFAGVFNFASYWFSDKIVLRAYGAAELSESEAPQVHRMVRELAESARIPMPRVYVIDQESPNAFATGRNPQHAAIALTRGIMSLMSQEQLRGVVAHELSHVLSRDTLIQTVAATLAGAIMFLAQQMRFLAFFSGGHDDDDRGGNMLGVLLMAILAPIAAMLIQLAISRSREYKADASAAQMTHQPEGLASALEKLETYSKRVPLQATSQTAHLFIVNPLSGKSLLALFSTHPPIAERVARLRQMRIA